MSGNKKTSCQRQLSCGSKVSRTYDYGNQRRPQEYIPPFIHQCFSADVGFWPDSARNVLAEASPRPIFDVRQNSTKRSATDALGEPRVVSPLICRRIGQPPLSLKISRQRRTLTPAFFQFDALSLLRARNEVDANSRRCRNRENRQHQFEMRAEEFNDCSWPLIANQG